MADIDLVLARITADPEFAAQLRADPRSTLSSYKLSDADFARVERAVSAAPAPTPAANPAAGVNSLFAPAAGPDSEPAAGATIGATSPRQWWSRPPWQGALGAALVVGAVVGFGLGHARSPGDAPPASTAAATLSTAGLTPVAYSACPAEAGASHLGDFHRGDQIWVVGRDTTGQWLQVRDPAGDRVWVARSAVTAADVERLAVVTCDLPSPASPTATAIDGSPVPGTDPAPAGDPGATTSTTSTASTVTTSTISGGGQVPTPVPTRPPAPGAPGDPTPTTTTPPVTPPVTTSTPGPTVPADHAGPLIEKVGGNPPDIWERYPAAGGRCVSQTSSIVSASVTDPSGVTTVQVDWIVAGPGGAHGTAGTSRSGSTWSATVGPVEWSAGAIPATGVDVTVTVHAGDGAGNTSTATTTLHLHSAQECIG